MPASLNSILSQIGGGSPKITVFSVGGSTSTTVSFTATQAGTSQILIAGITPTGQSGHLYSVLKDGVTLLQHQTVGADTTIYFEGPPGVYQVVPEALTISSVALPNGVVGSAYSQTLTATGGTAPYTWSGTMPAGLSLNSATGTIAGAPTSAGTTQITVQVTDSASFQGVATLTMSLTVAARLISNSAFPDLSAAVGSPVHSPALASGGAPPYNCVATSPLPAGVSLNASSCALTGTPTVPGIYSLTVSASDSSVPAQTAALSFSGWGIANAVEITNRFLPSGAAGPLKAAGGYPPYSNWTVVSGALPAGWSLNAATGLLQTVAGSTPALVTLTVQDSAGNVSEPRTFTTAPNATTTTLTTGVSGLSATVSSPWAEGGVTLFDGVSIVGSSLLSAEQATFSARLLLPGNHTLRAQYVGDTGDAPSLSAALPHTVAANPQIGLGAPVSYATASGPGNAFMGDFNGDGNPDLVVATAAGFDLLKGNSDGTFQPTIHIAAAPGFLTAGDFNGDGNLDVAIAQAGLPLVGILRGNGNGTFQSAVVYRIASPGSRIASADLNSDGIADLAVLDTTGVSILLGHGDGTFYFNGHTGSPAGSLAIADFNGDGLTDLALSPTAGGIAILTGIGDGTFQTSSAGASASGQLAAADFNGDGFTDLAAGNGVLLGHGDGTFAALQSYPGGASGAPVPGDFNGDGKPDIALTGASGITLLFGNGDGTFTSQAVSGAGGPMALAGDFNNDARTDLAVVSSGSSSVGVYLGLAPLTITCTPTAGPISPGTAWSASCSAAGGTGPYTWSIGSGAMPAGLTLSPASGTISGTPTDSGAYAFTLKVTDAGSPAQTAAQAWSGTLVSAVTSAAPVTNTPAVTSSSSTALPAAGPTVTMSPGALTFSASPGIVPAPQAVSLTSAVANTTFTANAVTNGGTWLSVSPQSGITDSQHGISVSVNPAGLGQGTYTGTVSVLTSSGGVASVAVSLNVQAQLTVIPASISLVYTVGGAAPAAQVLSAFSNPTGAPISITATSGQGLSWLTASGSGKAPLSSAISVNPTALPAGTYSGTVTVSSSNAPSVNVPVTLTVLNATPKLSVTPASQAFTVSQVSAPAAGQFVVKNTGGGTLRFTAQASATQAGWLTLAGSGTVSGTATPSSPAPVNFSVNPAGLAPGRYQGQITVSAAGLTSAVVPVTMVVNAFTFSLSVSQTALTFTAQAGGIKPAGQTFSTNGTAQATVPWLALSEASNKVTVTADPTGLAPGRYYGTIGVTAPGAANNPQTVSVLLVVTAAGKAVSRVGFSTGGVISMSATPQQVTLHNGSDTPVNYAATGETWLSVGSSSGSLPPGDTTLAISSSATAGSGVAWGNMRFVFDTGQAGAVGVAAIAGAGSGCVPSYLLPVFRQPVGGSVLEAGVAQQVQLQLMDNCGAPVTAGQGGAAQVLFDSGDAPVTLADTGGGVWEAAWVPNAVASPVALQAVASEQGLGLASMAPGGVAVTVQPADPNAPGVVSGIVNAASAAQALPGVVTPGAYVAIYGAGLAGGDSPLASSIPLPGSLNGTQVLLGNQPMPLVYASAAQVNALVPQGLNANTSYPLVILRNGTVSPPVAVTVDALQPAIYTQDLSGAGQGIVEIAGTAMLAAPSGTSGMPARRGTDYLEVFATGLGPVVGSNGEAPPADAAAPLTTVYRTVSPVTATLGGVDAPVVFAGLTPSLVGLYQVNVQVPAGAPAGGAVPLVLTVGGVVSNEVTVAIQ